MRSAASSGQAGAGLGGLMVVPGLLWLAVFAVLPLGFLATVSLWKHSLFGLTTEVSLDAYRIIANEPVYARVLWQTLRIALVTTLLSLVISYPLATCMPAEMRWRTTLRTMPAIAISSSASAVGPERDGRARGWFSRASPSSGDARATPSQRTVNDRRRVLALPAARAP